MSLEERKQFYLKKTQSQKVGIKHAKNWEVNKESSIVKNSIEPVKFNQIIDKLSN